MNEPQFMTESNQFNEKIQNINTQFFSALDDFKKYDVYYNKNPQVNEFQNYYTNSKGQIQTISKNLFILTNDIYKSIEELDKNMSIISKKLNIEKQLYEKMNELALNLDNTQNGTEILITDSKTNYNAQYYHNIEIFVGTIIISSLLATMFNKNI